MPLEDPAVTDRRVALPDTDRQYHLDLAPGDLAEYILHHNGIEVHVPPGQVGSGLVQASTVIVVPLTQPQLCTLARLKGVGRTSVVPGTVLSLSDR